MEIVDKGKLEIAIQYVQRITEGHNPVNNMPVDDDSVINNANVVRCMYFVKDVLEKVYKNEGYIGRIPRSKLNKMKQPFPLDCLSEFEYTGDKTITRLTEQINSMIDTQTYMQVSFSRITKWLEEYGYLQESQLENGKKKTRFPTEKGIKLGISSEKRIDANGHQFDYVIYRQNAQEFIVDNMSSILERDE